MRGKTIYKDKAGNKLVKTFIKTRNIYQLKAYNKQGQIVNPSGLRTMVKKAGFIARIPRKAGTYRVQIRRRR